MASEHPDDLDLLDAIAELDALDDVAFLRLWRFAPSGHRLMSGRAGDHALNRLRKMREDGKRWTELSKLVGWERG